MKYQELKQLLKEEQEKNKKLYLELETLSRKINELIYKYTANRDNGMRFIHNKNYGKNNGF
jgi:regulator of replication initiation timing